MCSTTLYFFPTLFRVFNHFLDLQILFTDFFSYLFGFLPYFPDPLRTPTYLLVSSLTHILLNARMSYFWSLHRCRLRWCTALSMLALDTTQTTAQPGYVCRADSCASGLFSHHACQLCHEVEFGLTASRARCRTCLYGPGLAQTNN